MVKNYWLVMSAVFSILMVMAIILDDKKLTSTSLICCLICHAVEDLRKKN